MTISFVGQLHIPILQGAFEGSNATAAQVQMRMFCMALELGQAGSCFVLNLLMWHCIAGTHDNETAVGWWKDSATEEDRAYLKKYLNTEGDDIAWLFIRSAFSSVSRTAIVLMQARALSSHVHALLLNYQLWPPCHVRITPPH